GSPSSGGCAIEIAGSVKAQASVGRSSIRSPLERIKHALRPAARTRCQLEHGAAAGAAYRADIATLQGRAVEIAGSVEDNASRRFAPVTAAAETVENRFAPAAGTGRQLEDRAASKIAVGAAAEIGRAIEVPGCI